MTKKLWITYVLWFFGGWFGLHHFYLERDRQAFVWWCLFAGYGGVGWFGDMFRIPKYVNEANMDDKYLLAITEQMRASPKPRFSLYRLIGQIVFGNLLAWVIYRAVPEEEVLGYSWTWLHIFIPLGSAIGVHTVGNISREKGPLLPSLILAYVPYVFYTADNPRYYISSVLAALIFRKYTEWNREPPKKRSLVKRTTVLATCGLIYFSLFTSYLYFNMELPNEFGEHVKFRESFHNLLKSPLWGQLADSFKTLWQFYQANGWRPLWDMMRTQLFTQMWAQLDPMGERNALSVLELPSSASQEDIKQRWRQLSKKYHPDKFKDPEEKAEAQAKFMEVKEAYEKISVLNARRKKRSSQSV